LKIKKGGRVDWMVARSFGRDAKEGGAKGTVYTGFSIALFVHPLAWKVPWAEKM